jgi:anaerobic magnesium-protoporphyrin IX monomethyl ester cyclase
LYVVSFLRSKGIDADFIDREACMEKKNNYQDYDIIGFSVTVSNIENTLKTVEAIKRINPRAEIVLGGSYATVNTQALLKIPNIDAVVVGEGEESFYEYVSGVAKDKIKGIYSKIDGVSHFGGERGWIRDLDALPFPALDKVDIKKYNILVAKKLPASTIVTSRGCPYKCIFCYHTLGYEWRPRSPENVVDEIEWQVKVIGVKEINIYDNNFSFDMERAKSICDKIIERKIKVSLQTPNGLRVDRVDEELLRKMRAAGVWSLCLAPETGSLETFRRIGKGFKLEDTEKVVKLAKKIGMSVSLNLIIGFPWETKDDFNKTFNFAYKLNTDFVDIARIFISPGSKLYNMVNDEKKEDVLCDKHYMLTHKDNNDEANRMAVYFHRKFYLNPIRLVRIIIILGLFSPRKIFKVLQAANLFLIIRMRFGLIKKCKVEHR